jgi:hypothetical protein
MPTYPPPPFTAALTGDVSNPDCRCTHSGAALFCMTGHITECHYPLSCDDAQCNHWERVKCMVGRYPETKE